MQAWASGPPVIAAGKCGAVATVASTIIAIIMGPPIPVLFIFLFFCSFIFKPGGVFRYCQTIIDIAMGTPISALFIFLLFHFFAFKPEAISMGNIVVLMFPTMSITALVGAARAAGAKV